MKFIKKTISVACKLGVLTILALIIFFEIKSRIDANFYTFFVEFAFVPSDLSSDTQVYYDGVPVGTVARIETRRPNPFVNEDLRSTVIELKVPSNQIIDRDARISIIRLSRRSEPIVSITPSDQAKKIEIAESEGPTKAACDSFEIICDRDRLQGSFDDFSVSEYLPETTEFCPTHFWINNIDKWAISSPEEDFDTVFDVDLFQPDITLFQSLQGGQTLKHKLAKIATTLLLNRNHPYIDQSRLPRIVEFAADPEYSGLLKGVVSYIQEENPSLLEETPPNITLIELEHMEETSTSTFIVAHVNEIDLLLSNQNNQELLEDRCPLVDIDMNSL